ncbi:MAG: hypothetical protein F4Z36_02120 [Acidimicrobiia bacterium]|nr:hypothetical protein [Acidimicrobiia bacterium]
MDHTNTRPQGLTIQGTPPHLFTDDTDLDPIHVSVRDADFLPVNEAAVDTFYHKTGDNIEPFNDNGNCNDVVMGKCDDLGGYLTDADGNFALPLTPGINATKGDYKVYVWTGQDGETFDSDDHSAQTADIRVNNDASTVKVTTTHGDTLVGDNTENIEEGDLAKFGETVTVTIQLQDQDEEDVAKPDIPIILTVTKNLGSDADPDNPDLDAVSTESSTMTRPTDDDGKIQLTYTKNDPNHDKDNEDADRGQVVVRVYGADGTDPLSNNLVPNGDITVTITWDDKDSEPTSIELTRNKKYVKLPKDGKSNARISAKVLDQYGDVIPGLRVNFRSSSDPAPDASNGVTTDLGDNSDGVHAPERTVLPISYSVDEGAENDNPGATQSFGAFYDPDGDGNPLTGDVVRVGLDESDNSVDDESESLTKIYWAIDATLSEIPTGNVALADIDENTIVVTHTGGALYVTYDSDDQFTVAEHIVGTATIPEKNVLLSEFEKALKDGQGTLRWTNNEDDSGAGVNRFTYDPPDATS